MIPAYANVYLKTTITKQNIKIILIAGVPSSQVLPGYLIAAPPSVCVPGVIGVLAVRNKKINQNKSIFPYPGSIAGVPFDFTGRLWPTLSLHTTCVRS